jgi:putative lipoprotein
LPSIAALAFLLARSSSAAAADPDPWFGRDKALHFGVSAAIASGSYAVSAALFDARGHALLLAGGVTMAVGIGKETLDLAGYGDPSWKDLAADAAGMIVGLALSWSVDLLVRGVGDHHPLFVSPTTTDPPAVSSGAGLRRSGLVLTF